MASVMKELRQTMQPNKTTYMSKNHLKLKNVYFEMTQKSKSNYLHSSLSDIEARLHFSSFYLFPIF